MARKQKRDFDRYIITQEPLPWTVVTDHPNAWLIGNDELTINYIRFNLIMDAVYKHFVNGSVIVDIGVFPGIMPKIFYEFYPKAGYEYYGCGMGFNAAFKEKMSDFKVRLLECDLDPRLHLYKDRQTSVPLEQNLADFCIFTDIIEHFFDPLYPLKEANRVCKPGAIMILTTDNLARAGWGLLKGISPNVPLAEGNLFYEGDWRPHFREYTKNELFQLLKWAGFDVVSHQFYDAEFGLYRVLDNRLKKTVRNEKHIFKKTKKNIRSLLNKAIPRLRDNHIMIARKTVDYETVQKTSPKIVRDMKDWVLQRKRLDHEC